MKKINLFIFALVMMGISALQAQQTVTLLFTGAASNNAYQQLGSVVITNITRNWTETIYYPDTILNMPVSVGITEMNNAVSAIKTIPNPFNGSAEVSVSLTQTDNVLMQLFDVNGRLFAESDNTLPQGTHLFHINLTTPQTYFLTITTPQGKQTVKMINTGKGINNSISYKGATGAALEMQLKSTATHPFQPGDMMQYVGYASNNGQVYESRTITQPQNASEVFVLQFEITPPPTPCGSNITDIDGNSYPTVQLGTQCWMAKNLRTTKYATGTTISMGSSTSTSTAYRYYPNNNSSNVSSYGYLYNWKAVMGNSSSSTSNPSGVQGICPTGWHVPSNAEWTQMTTWVGSQSQYTCDGSSTKIAKALASTSGWTTSTNPCAVGNGQSSNNATGFSAPPAGYYNGSYDGFGNDADFWSATEYANSYAYNRDLFYANAYVYSGYDNKSYGFSVRCLRD